MKATVLLVLLLAALAVLVHAKFPEDEEDGHEEEEEEEEEEDEEDGQTGGGTTPTTRPEFSNGVVTVSWVVDAARNLLTIEASAKTNGYLSIGFADGGKFHNGGQTLTVSAKGVDSYMALAGRSSGQSQPVTLTSSPFQILSTGFVNGLMTVKFTRPLTGSGLTAIENKLQYGFWAIGGSSISTNNKYLEHSSKGRFNTNFLSANTPPIASEDDEEDDDEDDDDGTGGGGGGGTGTGNEFTTNNFHLIWAVVGKSVEFTMDAPVNGWVSFGMNSGTNYHSGGDALTCWLGANNSPVCLDGRSSSKNMPRTRSTSQFLVTSGSSQGGRIFFTFSRPLTGGDLRPIENKNQQFFWAVATRKPSGTTTYDQHSSFGRFSANLITGTSSGGGDDDDDGPMDPGSAFMVSALVPLFALTLFRRYRTFQMNTIIDVPNANTVSPYTKSSASSSVETFSMIYVIFRRMMRQNIFLVNFTIGQFLGMSAVLGIAILWTLYWKQPTFYVGDSWGFLAVTLSFLSIIPATKYISQIVFFVPFERMIIYHRWLGRFTFVSALVHYGYYIAQWRSLGLSVWEKTFQEEKNLRGFFALVSFGIVNLTSFNFIRRKWHHGFKLLHYSFLVAFLCMALHTEEATGYVLGALVIYSLDSLPRVIYGFMAITPTSVELLPGDVLKLEFPKFRSYNPGQWVLVKFPYLSIMEWHPYSLASAPHETKIQLLIRASGNHTTRLLQAAKLNPRKLLVVNVSGPHGMVGVQYKTYETLVLATGGIGITVCASILKDLFLARSVVHRVKRVYLIWSFRDGNSWIWLRDNLREMMKVSNVQASAPEFHVLIYHTCKPGQPGYVDPFEFEDKRIFNIQSKRPDFNEILQTVEQQVNPQSAARIATITCGPKLLVHNFLRTTISRSNQTFQYDNHEEVFEF